MITMDQNEVWDYLNTSLELHILQASWVIYQFRTVENETGHLGNKKKSYFWFRDLWRVKSPPKVTLVVWLVCHSNSKLAFHFLVTFICLSNLTVVSPSKDTNIYPRHMIANKKWDNSWGLGGQNTPKVTLVVWLVCHSNSKLVFHFLVTIICLSSLTVLTPSKDTNIYSRHMIATKKWDNSWGVRGSKNPQSDYSCLAVLSQQQQVGLSLFSNNHMPKQFNCAAPFTRHQHLS